MMSGWRVVRPYMYAVLVKMIMHCLVILCGAMEQQGTVVCETVEIHVEGRVCGARVAGSPTVHKS